MGRGAGSSGQDGFTLVEMLVTLAVLGLAATVAFQSLGRGALDRRAATVSETVAAEIDRLRAEAIRSGRGARLAFEPRDNLFVSSRPGAAPIPARSVQIVVEGGTPERPVPGEIRLLPDGSSTGGRIHFAAGTERRTLTVSALTGRVRRAEAP